MLRRSAVKVSSQTGSGPPSRAGSYVFFFPAIAAPIDPDRRFFSHRAAFLND